MSSPIRIAVAGAGAIGQAHIKRVLEEPQAELAAILDPSPKARDQAASLGVPWFADLEIGLQSAKPDGVVIATPNQLHVPNGLTAVKVGLPMLLEKPVSDDVESALKLVTTAEAAGVSILVGHHRRHSPLIQRAREIVVRATRPDYGRHRAVPAHEAQSWLLRRCGRVAQPTSC